MDRPIAYVQEQGRSTDFLFAQRSTMIAIAKLSQAVFGSNTVVRGLAVTPNSPAALNVLVGIGEIYTLASVDATTYGSLPADTTDQIVQQGLNMAAQTISTPAPTTAGYSINYLIEAQFQSQDTNPVVLPFYNSANPQQPLNGQGGGGAALPTERQGVCVIQAKAGIAATTGTQVTPTVDSGWTALAVVTVANGQASVGSSNISIPAGVPQITSLLQMMQTDATNYAGLAGGTANAITATLSPAPASYSDYLLVTVRVANTNTGSVSLNVNGLGAVPVIGLGHQVLQGGELFAGGFATFAYSTNYSEAILLECTGGALQIAPATQPLHAVQFGQVAGVVGSVRNLVMSVTAASATATLTADEIIVETALGGLRYCLANFNQTINLGTTGAGGMDTGSAPVSGYVALYAIYKPSTQTAALLATNATSAAVGNVYGGANMPSGYTASALVSVWPTNGSGQFVVGAQSDRRFYNGSPTLIVSSTTQVSSYTAVNVSSVVPKSARTIEGWLGINSTSATSPTTQVAGNSVGVGQRQVQSPGTGAVVAPFIAMPMLTSQTIYWTSTVATGTFNTGSVTISGYEI